MKVCYRFFGVLLTVVLLVSLLCSCMALPQRSTSFAFFVKDDQLVMMDVASKKTYPVTQHLDTEQDRRSAGMIRLDENSTRLFYLDRESDDEDAQEYLYMRDLTKLKANPVRIDSTTGIFDISKDGKTLLYLKREADSGCSLYQYDGKQSSLVTDSLIGFGFTQNEDLAYYRTVEDPMDYTLNKEENYRYHLVSDPSAVMTLEEFKAKTGGARPYTYAFEGINISTYALGYNEETVDRDEDLNDKAGRIRTGDDCEAYYYDRLLYFVSTEEEKTLNIKQYIKGEEPQVIGQLTSDGFPVVAYTSDGLPLYLQDYDKDTKQGKLMLYKDGESILLEEGNVCPVGLDRIVNWTYSVQKHMVWF